MKLSLLSGLSNINLNILKFDSLMKTNTVIDVKII